MRRFVLDLQVPAVDEDGKKGVRVRGHWIGPGRRSVLTLRRRTAQQSWRNALRGRDHLGRRIKKEAA